MVKTCIVIAVIILTLLCVTFLVGAVGYVTLSSSKCDRATIVSVDRDVVNEVMAIMDEVREAQDRLHKESLRYIFEQKGWKWNK